MPPVLVRDRATCAPTRKPLHCAVAREDEGSGSNGASGAYLTVKERHEDS